MRNIFEGSTVRYIQPDLTNFILSMAVLLFLVLPLFPIVYQLDQERSLSKELDRIEMNLLDREYYRLPCGGGK